MKLTFLGHQGWMIESTDYRLLVDPIVRPYFRNSAHSRVWVYPPRRLALERLGRIDAVFFTHEHEDHFHIESIHALDRDTTIYLSGNMSGSAERILHEMGFARVRRLFAMEEIALGNELTMTLFPPPGAVFERWVLQPFIVGREYTDSFFNPVDCPVSKEFLAKAQRESINRLGVVCMANNTQVSRAFGNPHDLKDRQPLLGMDFEPARMLGAHLRHGDLPPVRFFAVVGGGFIEGTAPFGTYQCGSQKRLAEVLREFSHGRSRIVGPDPGEWIDLGADDPSLMAPEPAGIAAPSPEGAAALAEAEAKAAAYVPKRRYDPVTGGRTLPATDMEAIDQQLARLAERFSVHPMHAELIQQGFSRAEDGTPLPFGEGRLLLMLLVEVDGKRSKVAFEYQPMRRRFLRLRALPPGDLPRLYPFGFECWASDFLALCRGGLSVYEIIKHRYRAWVPEARYTGRHDFALALEQLFAPEVSPETTYRLYRSAYDRCRGAPARCGGADGGRGSTEPAGAQ